MRCAPRRSPARRSWGPWQKRWRRALPRAWWGGERGGRGGGGEGEHVPRERAAAATEPALADAELALAAWSGPGALTVLRRVRAKGWSGDEKARSLQLLG